MAINWTTVQDAITATMNDKLEERSQAVTESLHAGITSYYDELQKYTDAATALASLVTFLSDLNTWIDANGMPTTIQIGEEIPDASRAIILSQIETEVEESVGSYVDNGVSDRYPAPEAP